MGLGHNAQTEAWSQDRSLIGRDASHLYVHVPFCAHRCGYCDFVTTSAQPELHDRYVAAVQQEWRIRYESEHGDSTAAVYDTIFIGGGTPTLLQPGAFDRLIDWAMSLLAQDGELSVECNPETVDDRLAAALAGDPRIRVSLGAQSLSPHVLSVLERRATPDTVRSAVERLRDAGVGNLSIDMIWAIPGQRTSDLHEDLLEIIDLGPDHISAYELELKPGTRLAHTLGRTGPAPDGLEDIDDHYDLVVDTLTSAGYEWYETANFARGQRLSRHNLGYWLQHDYDAVGIGAVSTRSVDGGDVAAIRRNNLPNLPRYMAAVEDGSAPPERREQIDRATRGAERIMLGMRLSQPLELSASDAATYIERPALDRLAAGGVLAVADLPDGGLALTLTRRGRMMLNSVISEVLV